METVNHAGIALIIKAAPPSVRRMLFTPLGYKKSFGAGGHGACCMISSLLFMPSTIYESYINGLEDVDLCLRAHARQWRVGVCGQSLIVHHGSSTPGRFDAETQNQNAFKNSGTWSFRLDEYDEQTASIGQRFRVRDWACSKLPIVRELLRAVTRCGMGVRYTVASTCDQALKRAASH